MDSHSLRSLSDDLLLALLAGLLRDSRRREADLVAHVASRWTNAASGQHLAGLRAPLRGREGLPAPQALPVPALPRSREEQPRLVAVVAAAAQLDVLGRRLAAGRVRAHVVELDERALVAAAAVRTRR
jgi:hypothetical protein